MSYPNPNDYDFNHFIFSSQEPSTSTSAELLFSQTTQPSLVSTQFVQDEILNATNQGDEPPNRNDINNPKLSSMAKLSLNSFLNFDKESTTPQNIEVPDPIANNNSTLNLEFASEIPTSLTGYRSHVTPLASPSQPSSLNFQQNNSLNTFNSVYSSSGFDLLSILAYIANRPNPQIDLGPVDMSCALLVVDARKFDFPIVYCSKPFEFLTGYNEKEIIGRNCRFLQAPDGHVSLGSRRRFCDNQSVYQIKHHMMQGKESQVSLVNYKKGGQPFINLVTVVPISLDGEEVSYFVGFQVDLVEQPNAILERMKDGTFAVNYSHLNIPPSCSNSLFNGFPEFQSNNRKTFTPVFPATAEIFDIMGTTQTDESSLQVWNQILLENSDDFIHVISLKGIFLYCSKSCQKLLGYEPEELLGQSISKVCHPSDLVPVMRELKEASNHSEPISFIYRAKKKSSDYIWIEVQGKLHSDQGKGRKSVVLTARPRTVYQLSRDAVSITGGIQENEFWAKLSLDGLYLFVTSSCQNILGVAPDELISTSLYQLVRSDRTTALTRALEQARNGTTVRLRHHIQSKRGQYVEVMSTFFPGEKTSLGKPGFIICRSRDYHHGDEGSSPCSSVSSTEPSPQTNQLASENDNLFDMLLTSRSSTWQYELHQLRLMNKKMKDALESIETSKKSKKRKVSPSSYKECSLCSRRSQDWQRSQGMIYCRDCIMIEQAGGTAQTMVYANSDLSSSPHA